MIYSKYLANNVLYYYLFQLNKCILQNLILHHLFLLVDLFYGMDHHLHPWMILDQRLRLIILFFFWKKNIFWDWTDLVRRETSQRSDRQRGDLNSKCPHKKKTNLLIPSLFSIPCVDLIVIANTKLASHFFNIFLPPH